MRKVAQVISNIFDPLLVIPIIFITTIGAAYLLGEVSLVQFVLLITIYLGMPGAIYFWMLSTKRINDPDISRRELRLPLFRDIIVIHLFGVAAAYWWQLFPLAYQLTMLWLVLLTYALLTRYIKVSIHAGVNTILVLIAIWRLGSWGYALAWIPLVVGLARVIDKQHTVAQVILGIAVALLLFSPVMVIR
jgi:hypothetical protein